MYKVTVNENYQFEIDTASPVLMVNAEAVQLDSKDLTPGSTHVLHNNKSYTIEMVSEDKAEKTAVVKVNGNIYQVKVEDQFDQLLKQLGLNNLTTNKFLEIKAPMPGLVLNILVQEGQEIKKGDNLLVLEAMKMENMIQSATDGTVKRILVNPGDKVEKNQVLVQFS